VSPEPEPNVDPLLWTAIEQRRLLRLRYRNKERIVEPHDYGIHHGIVKLFTCQIAGASSRKLPHWQWIETDVASDVQLLNQTFPGGRPTKSGSSRLADVAAARSTAGLPPLSQITRADGPSYQYPHAPPPRYIEPETRGADLARGAA